MLAHVLLWLGLAAAADTPITTSVCEVLEHPERYKDKLVSVRAEVELWFETQALHDGHCKEGVWFESDASGAPGLGRVAQLTKRIDFRWKTTATAIGYVGTGGCFGHQCYSQSVLVVKQFDNPTRSERRLAPDFSPHDCRVLRSETRVDFREGGEGHNNQFVDEPVFLPRLVVMLVNLNGDVVPTGPLLQVVVGGGRVKTIQAGRDGILRLPSLAPGAYVYSAMAPGFDSVQGCIVIAPGTKQNAPLRITLPLGV